MTVNKSLINSEELCSLYVKQDFDYSVLSPETQILVQQHTNEIKRLVRRTSEDIVAIGKMLLTVKEKLGHGNFETWLKMEFNWGQWTARKFMQVARQFQSVNFTDLSIDASSLYLLAAPSTPKIIREKSLEIAAQGEHITHAKVKAMISKYKELNNSNTSSQIQPMEDKVDINYFNPDDISLNKQSKEQEYSDSFYQCKSSGNTSQIVVEENNSYVCDKQAKTEKFLLQIGHPICLANVEQDCKWFGEVVEVQAGTVNEIEVVVKINFD